MDDLCGYTNSQSEVKNVYCASPALEGEEHVECDKTNRKECFWYRQGKRIEENFSKKKELSNKLE